jgi:hypothetical protein
MLMNKIHCKMIPKMQRNTMMKIMMIIMKKNTLKAIPEDAIKQEAFFFQKTSRIQT